VPTDAKELERFLENWRGTTRTGLRLGVGPQRVRDLVKEGKLVAIKTDVGMLVNWDSVEQLERERETARS
jgi:hypothetical protein